VEPTLSLPRRDSSRRFWPRPCYPVGHTIVFGGLPCARWLPGTDVFASKPPFDGPLQLTQFR
jgi:hypothetical protein